MGATEVVAVTGAITTPVVAIAGYVFGERRSNIEHANASELAEQQHAHEDQVRQSERRYEARRDIYLDVLKQFRVEQQIVDRTNNPESSREPPQMPDEGEHTELRARVDAFASPKVREAVSTFDKSVADFHDNVKTANGDDSTMAYLAETTMPEKRERVAWAYGEVRRLISSGLEEDM
jgi:hypothetical protein